MATAPTPREAALTEQEPAVIAMPTNEATKKKPRSRKTTSKKARPKRTVTKSAKKKSKSKKKPAAKKPAKATAKKKAKKKTAPKNSVAKKRPTKKRKPKKQVAPSGISKAQAIRDAAKELGGKPRPRDVIAALAAKRIAVASAQVSMVLKAAGLSRRRRRRKVVMAMDGAAASSTLTTADLLQVKELALQLGGTDRLKEAVAALEQLL